MVVVALVTIFSVVVVVAGQEGGQEGGQVLHEQLVEGSGRCMDFQDHDTCDTDGIVQTQPGRGRPLYRTADDDEA